MQNLGFFFHFRTSGYRIGKVVIIQDRMLQDGVTYIVHDRLLHFITYSIGHVVTADFRLCPYRTCSVTVQDTVLSNSKS